MTHLAILAVVDEEAAVRLAALVSAALGSAALVSAVDYLEDLVGLTS